MLYRTIIDILNIDLVIFIAIFARVHAQVIFHVYVYTHYPATYYVFAA